MKETRNFTQLLEEEKVLVADYCSLSTSLFSGDDSVLKRLKEIEKKLGMTNEEICLLALSRYKSTYENNK